MIANWATDAPQGHKKVIGFQGIMELILMLRGPKTLLSLPKQPDRSLGFADILSLYCCFFICRSLAKSR